MGTPPSTSDKTPTPIGRLSTFGISKEQPHFALCLPPNRYDDLRHSVHSLAEIPEGDEGTIALVAGYISKTPRYDPIKKRSKVQIRLRSGDYLDCMLFGKPEVLPDEWRTLNSSVHAHGKVVRKPDGFTMMFQPKPITPEMVGRCVGVYPQKKGVISSDRIRGYINTLMTPESVRELMSSFKAALAPYHIPDLLNAWSRQNDYPQVAETNLARILYRLHCPVTPGQGELARHVLADLDALAVILAAQRERPTVGVFQQVRHNPQKLAKRIAEMDITPTDEQITAVSEALEDMAAGNPMHRLLSGDVGTGKTIVLALVAASVVDAGGTVAIILPNSQLTEQFSASIDDWWGDIPLEVVTYQSKGRDASGANTGGIKIGTTALLHRYGDWQPTLTIVDEQQKYSIEQRQHLSRHGGHLLEATATCLPRTAAQVIYGLVPQSRLLKPHTPKTIHTDIFDAGKAEDRRALFHAMKDTLDHEGQTLVVFAARDEKEATSAEKGTSSEEGSDKPVPKVIPLERGFATWANAAPAGEVVALHGKMSQKEKSASLEAMRSGEAKVMCATISAEVGLNIPNLRQVIIYNAERLGLTQLHQLRGRVARLGGEGRCDLFVEASALTEQSKERLDALCNTTDGFELAEIDMKLRGIGELLSHNNRQSGNSLGQLLVNHKATLENFEAARNLIEEVAIPAPKIHPKVLSTFKREP